MSKLESFYFIFLFWPKTKYKFSFLIINSLRYRPLVNGVSLLSCDYRDFIQMLTPIWYYYFKRNLPLYPPYIRHPAKALLILEISRIIWRALWNVKGEGFQTHYIPVMLFSKFIHMMVLCLKWSWILNTSTLGGNYTIYTTYGRS